MNRQYIDFQSVKQVPLEVILQRLGAVESPKNKAGATYAWFFSPLRRETSPSFRVVREANYWKDFGDGTCGTSIDLVLRLGLAADCYSAARWIADHFLSGRDDGTCPPPTIMMPAKSAKRGEPGAKLVRVRDISSPKLIKYFEGERGIPRDILCSYCQEIHYCTDKGGIKYGAGIPTQNGGYAVRSPYSKVTVGQPGVSLLVGTNRSCLLFEGMTNMLSYVVLHGRPSADMMVLNSTGNVHDAIQTMGDYSSINCFLDNDAAGKNATEEILRAFGDKATDFSGMYSGFNDLNDYLVQALIYTI